MPTPLPLDHEVRMMRARRALDGLSVGDAFGERFFMPPERARWLIAERAMPAAPWRWTDDTAMALSIVETLRDHGSIVRGVLAKAFARRFALEPWRGYGGGALMVLEAIDGGVPFDQAARMAFGEGSMGNGAAMRVAPLGAYFADDLARATAEAAASADPTHVHPEGRAGAIAVAVAAAVCAQRPADIFEAALAYTPDGKTREGIEAASRLPPETSPVDAATKLGNGSRVVAWDTVPFCLWCAARHPGDYEAALWCTVEGLGDRDTTCAIVGGIVACNAEIPNAYLEAREPLSL